MDEPKTVSATTARPRGAWIAAAAVLVMGLLLLNVDEIGRMAIHAYERMQSRQAEREQANREAPAIPASPAAVHDVPAVETRPLPAVDAHPVAPMSSAGVTSPARTTRPMQPAPAAQPGQPAQPLAPLYPSPVAAPPPPAGHAGLVMLMRSGALRPASGNDLAHWKMRYASNNPGGIGRRFGEWAQRMPAYVILGDMTVPDGLAGANSVIFLLGDKAPFPTGDLGHSIVLDPATGSCVGQVCGMLMER